MKREEQIRLIADANFTWDVAVIGGGATGLGICLDAALRGLKVALFEKADFSKGTSSRSTKLVHGGVRYLAKGDIGLVMEALYERGLLMKNAPHLVKNQSFIIPVYTWWDAVLYTVGLMFYDMLSGKLSLGKSGFISASKVLKAMPHLRKGKLKGGIVYHDGQFDDSRLAINLAQSCVENGGCVLNYMPATALLKDADGKLTGLLVKDEETDISYKINARTVINATGVFVDEILRMDQPGIRNIVKPSQGVHLVVDQKFLAGQNALMIPKTADGRVLFAIPWHGKLVLGTTDTLVDQITDEPKALNEEIDFILNTASGYLSPSPEKSDIFSVFAGLRPLAAPTDTSRKTKEISRRHKIIQSSSGLITITGGKWTTYRRMAEDAVDLAVQNFRLTASSCTTRHFKIHGLVDSRKMDQMILENPALGEKLHPDYEFTYAGILWAVREEMARTTEDVLARRFRLLFLDVKACIGLAPEVTRIIAEELDRDRNWQIQQVERFGLIAKNFTIYST